MVEIKSISIPIDESKHIKAMYDYLIDITNKEEDIRWRAISFISMVMESGMI